MAAKPKRAARQSAEMDAAGNNHAMRMLQRYMTNLRDFFGQFALELLRTHYGPEMLDLYLRSLL
jgi:RIO kinase 1